MNQSKPVSAQFRAPLRSLALTVEETAPGDFRWRILEGFGNPPVFESVSCANRTFSAYDTALATGYGELQRLIGLELQHGPRAAPDAVVDFIRLASTPRPRPVERADPVKSPPVTGGGFTPAHTKTRMKPDLKADYTRLRTELEALMAQPVKDFARIDQIVHQLEQVQLAIKEEHGVKGNNPNE